MISSTPLLKPHEQRFYLARPGGLLLFRRVYDRTHLPWYRDMLLALDGRPGLAAGAQVSAHDLHALILVWCAPDDAGAVRGALTPLDPILGRASVGEWPARLAVQGPWQPWIGTPHTVAVEYDAGAFAPDWLRDLQQAVGEVSTSNPSEVTA